MARSVDVFDEYLIGDYLAIALLRSMGMEDKIHVLHGDKHLVNFSPEDGVVIYRHRDAVGILVSNIQKFFPMGIPSRYIQLMEDYKKASKEASYGIGSYNKEVGLEKDVLEAKDLILNNLITGEVDDFKFEICDLRSIDLKSTHKRSFFTAAKYHIKTNVFLMTKDRYIPLTAREKFFQNWGNVIKLVSTI